MSAPRSIARLAREHDIERQVQQARGRRALRRAASRIPAVLREYARMLAAATAGYWVLAAAISWATGAEVTYLLLGLAMLFAAQATSYKIKLARDPSYEISGCGCGAGGIDGSATVLTSRYSALFGVPVSVLALVLYAALAAALAAGESEVAVALALVAVVASAYLGHAMVARIGAVCSTCINIAALNVLLLLQVV
jgi:uncharacterized membrane protein